MTKYTITIKDHENTPAWLDLCSSARAGEQDSGKALLYVETDRAEDLEKALEADDAVISYSEDRSEKIEAACAMASGRAPIPADAAPARIKAAHKDYNARGKCRAHWFRMVLRGGAWEYFGDRRLSNGTYLAADRNDTVRGDVFVGEIVASHDRGGPVDAIWLVIDASDKPLKSCEFKKRRDGQLAITLPDGTEVLAPNPRK